MDLAEETEPVRPPQPPATPEASQAADGPEQSTAWGWLRLGGHVLALTYLAFVAALLMWATLPALLGWAPRVVMTGSMAPSVRAGDVVLTAELDPATIRPGQVIAFHDPAEPSRILLHRVVRRDPQGNLVTRGDANPTADPSPVRPDQVEGLGHLRVPYIGLPPVWVHERDWLRLAIFTGLTGLALLLVVRAPRDPEPDPDPLPGPGPTSSDRGGLAGRGATAALALTALAALAAVHPPHVVFSAYAAGTDSPTNQWNASTLVPPSDLTATITCSSAAAPTFVATTSTTGGGSNVSLTVPLTTLAGHLLVAHVVRNNSTAITAPSGWTLIRSDTYGSQSGSWLYRRTATATDPGTTYTWTGSGSQGVGSLLVYAGASPTNPVDAHAGAGVAGGSSTLSAPSVTTTSAPTLLLTFFGVKQGDTVDPPTGMTQRQFVDNGVSSTVDEELLTVAGVTGTRSGKVKKKASEAEVQTLALRGAGLPTATLTWTRTTTTRASGYVLRRDGGAPTPVTPASTTSTNDGPLTNGVPTTWTLQTVAGTWTSTAATASATPSC